MVATSVFARLAPSGTRRASSLRVVASASRFGIGPGLQGRPLLSLGSPRVTQFRRNARQLPQVQAILGFRNKKNQASAVTEKSDPADGAVVTVFGASGRIGSLVVTRLLERGANVRGVVRDADRASETLPVGTDKLEICVSDLSSPGDVRAAVEGVDVAIWCVSLEENRPSPVELVKGLFKLGSKPSINVDLILEELLDLDQGTQLVLLSSAAVTRTAWSKDKKARLDTVVDIPIVRLNPFGTLDNQRKQEQRVRVSGVPYSVVRPVGLNSDWAPGRPVLAQGDVAVGRVNRQDVADVLIAAGFSSEATGKTFECITLQGYSPPADRWEIAFTRLFSDEERELAGEDLGFGAADPESPGEQAVTAQYNLMMQLLPGALQDPTKLEMGRTYEQVDAGEVNREKGAAATVRERKVAAGIRGTDAPVRSN